MFFEPWSAEKNIFARFFDKRTDLAATPSILGSPTKTVVLKQIHSAAVVEITALNIDQRHEADACVTRLAQTALTVHTADCVPLLGHEGEVIGACHGGWRGLSAGIIENWIAALDLLGAKRDKIKIAMGPSIGPCHFEVGLDVASQIVPKDLPVILKSAIQLTHPSPQKTFIDLRELSRFKLLKLGLLEQNISISRDCTFCNPDRYHSFRRDGAQFGRLEAIICRGPRTSSF